MKHSKQKIIGPFAQILSMDNLPIRGPIKDESLVILENGGLLVENGRILETGNFNMLHKKFPQASIEEQEQDMVAMPGWIDAHTHICFAGSRALDYAARNNGKSYLEIAKAGGGIWSTVTPTREASEAKLLELTLNRMNLLIRQGITTVEIKSGYGLHAEHELKMLRVIQQASRQHSMDVIPTCLAAHIIPPDFQNEKQYLAHILEELVPVIEAENLCQRFDIFVEESAFSVSAAEQYLNVLKKKGFQLTVHGDQFSTGGSQLAIKVGANSVDHLEASGENEINALAQSSVFPVVLPGASIGLGCNFAPARKLLDSGCPLVIASDWNPGSAPQGQLLTQAAILGAFEKLSSAEVFAGVTFRAAGALAYQDRGILAPGKMADITAFPVADFREILYHQGSLNPIQVWKQAIPKI